VSAGCLKILGIPFDFGTMDARKSTNLDAPDDPGCNEAVDRTRRDAEELCELLNGEEFQVSKVADTAIGDSCLSHADMVAGHDRSIPRPCGNVR